MASIAITEAELLEAVRKAVVSAPGPTDALTTIQLARALGIGDQAAYARIKRLFNAGLLECVFVPSTGMDGIVRPRAAYRLIKKPKKRG